MQLTFHVDHKDYGNPEQPILSQVQLTAAAGEFVALVGPSGAGKSTLLNIVAGLDTQFSGQLWVDDHPLHHGQQCRLRLGFMFQEARLMPWLTVLDNLLLVLGNRPDREAQAVTMLTAVGLGECLHAFPGQLSGGMQRRVALARAFVVQPQLLLMDEPFISVDAPTVQQLHELLLNLWQQHRPTVLLVTHTVQEAFTLADRVLFFSRSPAQVIDSQTIELTRPRPATLVTQLLENLLVKHPHILAGVL